MFCLRIENVRLKMFGNVVCPVKVILKHHKIKYEKLILLRMYKKYLKNIQSSLALIINEANSLHPIFNQDIIKR